MTGVAKYARRHPRDWGVTTMLDWGVVCVIWSREIAHILRRSDLITQLPAFDLQGQRSGGSGSAVRTTVDSDAGNIDRCYGGGIADIRHADGGGERKSGSWDRGYAISGVVVGLSVRCIQSINRTPRIDMASSLLCRLASKRGSVALSIATCGGCRSVKRCFDPGRVGFPAGPDQTDA